MGINWRQSVPWKVAVQTIGIATIIIVGAAMIVFSLLINRTGSFEQQAKGGYDIVTYHGYLANTSSYESKKNFSTSQDYLISATSTSSGLDTKEAIAPQPTLYPLDTGAQILDVLPFSQVTVQGYLQNGRLVSQSITTDQGQTLGIKTSKSIGGGDLPSLPPVQDIAAIGFHDTANCQNLTGWTCDGNRFTIPLQVHLYADGPAGSGRFVGAVTASQTREQAVANSCGGNANHGFSFAIPDSLKDQRVHPIYAYAIGIDRNGQPTGNNPLLNLSPKSISCSINHANYPPVSQDDFENEVVQGINDARAAVGLGSVSINNTLREAARYHSQDMAYRNYFSHYRQPPPLAPGVPACTNFNGGYTPFDRVHCAGYQYTRLGEILARNNYPDDDTVRITMQSWHDSPPHWAIVTACPFLEVGCGYAEGAERMHYFSCEFGTIGADPPACSVTPVPSLSPTVGNPTPTPGAGVSCCRTDPNGYIDRSYCPANCAACYGNIQCGTNGYRLVRWYFNTGSQTCQISNPGICRE